MKTFLNDPALHEARVAVTAAGLPLYPVLVTNDPPPAMASQDVDAALAMYHPVFDLLWVKPGIDPSLTQTCSVHEYAHAIFQRAGRGDMEMRRKIEAVLKAAETTSEIQMFAFASDTARAAFALGVDRQDARTVAKQMEYALDPDETWARAVEQYVSSGWMPQHWAVVMDPENGLSDLRWEAEDFQPIAAEFAHLFPPRRGAIAA